jgi:hypothetical protein
MCSKAPAQGVSFWLPLRRRARHRPDPESSTRERGRRTEDKHLGGAPGSKLSWPSTNTRSSAGANDAGQNRQIAPRHAVPAILPGAHHDELTAQLADHEPLGRHLRGNVLAGIDRGTPETLPAVRARRVRARVLGVVPRNQPVVEPAAVFALGSMSDSGSRRHVSLAGL